MAGWDVVVLNGELGFNDWRIGAGVRWCCSLCGGWMTDRDLTVWGWRGDRVGGYRVRYHLRCLGMLDGRKGEWN